ncbi:LITAF-like zinc ribbon domain [Nesidiocoris tenuis]|uniref:LITAF-like zinc ribbon domain n=1 Tax=Nesidiocoris tenuis TaxID=355587 RepID=A0ABN7BB67_9HEMI|nr:LITAF-like zinc ribbon domain [Nesidiocoris tenuis]
MRSFKGSTVSRDKHDPKKSSQTVRDDKRSVVSKAEEDRKMSSQTEKRREKKEEKQKEDGPGERGSTIKRDRAEKQRSMADPVPPDRRLIPPNVQLDAGVGPKSQPMYCPSCERRVRTRVMHDVTLFTHLIAILLCVVGCCCISCVPYCVDSCKSRNHYCPHCGHFFGTFK